jgi:uncharacterized membrane-anchored protein
MLEALFWVYLVNASLLIGHEIESAYWREWELFGLPGGVTLFTALHLPMVFVIIWAAAVLRRGETAGLIVSLLLASGGLFAFFIHFYFLRRGRPEFTLPWSKLLLSAILAASVVQAALTVAAFMAG